MEEKSQLSNLRVGGVSAEEIREAAADYIEDFRERVADADERVREIVSARPLACVAGAFAAGFIVARAFRLLRR